MNLSPLVGSAALIGGTAAAGATVYSYVGMMSDANYSKPETIGTTVGAVAGGVAALGIVGAIGFRNGEMGAASILGLFAGTAGAAALGGIGHQIGSMID